MVATIRGETEQGWRLFLVNLLGILGGLMIVGTVLVALFSRFSFLAGEGVVYLILGLLYVAGFINFQEGGTVRLRGLGAFSRYFVEDRDSVPFLTGFGIGCIGLIAVIGGIVKSAWPESLFLVPDGLILIGAGVLYLGVAAGICLDWPIVILTRRELASLFYSPVAYLVLAGMVAVGWLMLWNFVSDLAESSLPEQGRRAMLEPIVVRYIITIVPVIVQIFVIPAITMRLVAEEKQTGTLEVLLTAPVNEPTVVISKFLAAWFFNFLTWMPWWLNLVALRYMAETEFDYRPILCFNVTLLAVTAGFVSMGVFFSSLTRNQIIAAVLTFVGMMIHLVLYLIRFWVRIPEGTPLFDLLTYVSFLDVWIDSLQGLLAPRYLIFHLSLTIFFLYASIKVLEARKWS
jgi:ABC-type transport system involved in multi-copper enzyme maturation permease subunit